MPGNSAKPFRDTETQGEVTGRRQTSRQRGFVIPSLYGNDNDANKPTKEISKVWNYLTRYYNYLFQQQLYLSVEYLPTRSKVYDLSYPFRITSSPTDSKLGRAAAITDQAR
jgi:hypothetical protein